MDALCHQPFGLVRQPSGCCVRLLALGTARFQYVSRIGEADTERAFVAFLTSLGWRTSAAPTHYLDTLLGPAEPLADTLRANLQNSRRFCYKNHEEPLGAGAARQQGFCRQGPRTLFIADGVLAGVQGDAGGVPLGV